MSLPRLCPAETGALSVMAGPLRDLSAFRHQAPASGDCLADPRASPFPARLTGRAFLLV
ncbi:MAG: hypothetical protein AB7E60_07290 [Sphingobium sp.]